MRLGVSIRLDPAMFLLGTCLILLLTLQGCSSEIGGRHIRRITAADLPSSENEDAKRIKTKNIQSGSGMNCSLAEPCNSTNTEIPSSTPPISQESVDTASSKIVSSYVADDVLQGRLHVTTTSAPYAEVYDGTTASSIDDFGITTRPIQNETSLHSARYPNLQNSRLRSTLTTPKISTFDDFYAKLAEGIQQNLDVDEYPYKNIAQTHGISLPRYASAHGSTKKGNFSIADFKSNYSIVYNDSLSPQSVRRDVLTENSTSVTIEEFKIHTEVEPEGNHTSVHDLNDSHFPSVSVSNDNNHNNINNETSTIKSRSEAENIASSTFTVDTVNSTKQYSEKIINNTGTPGDKDSTTSEQTWGKPYIVSQELISDIQKGNISSVTNTPDTYTGFQKVENDNSSVVQHLVTSTQTNKSLKSQKTALEPTKKPTLSGNNFRSGKTLVFRLNGNSDNATIIDGTSETSATRPPENGLTNIQPTKKPKTRFSYFQILSNGTVVQTEETSMKPNSSHTFENVTLLTPSLDNTTIRDSDPSLQSTVTISAEVSTPEYSTSSRSRAFTFRRPYTTQSSHLNDETTRTTESSNIGSTTQTSNADRLRQRLTTRRRYQSSTEPNYTIVSSSNSTSQNSAVRGVLPSRTRKPTSTKSPFNEASISSDSAQNNEGNDITTPRNNVFKPVARNRGSVRYGSLRNNSLVSNSNYANDNVSVSFPLPPTAAAWSLVTLKGPENESRSINHPEDNTTIQNCTANTGPLQRISNEKDKLPCSMMETATTITSSVRSPGPGLSSDSTSMHPMLIRKQGSHTGGKEVQQQENNISKTQKLIPLSGQSESKVNESDSTTTAFPVEDEFPTSTKYPKVTTDSYTDTTISTINADANDTGSMEITIGTVDLYLETVKDSINESRFISEPQVIEETTPISADDSFLPEYESFNATSSPESTTSAETTTSEIENTTTEASNKEEYTTESSAPDNPFAVPIRTWLEGLTTSMPITTENPQIGPFEEESDQQNEAQEDVGAGAGIINDGNNPDEENKQNMNSQDGVQLEDINRSQNGDELRNEGTNVDASYNQGDLSIGNMDEVEENKNSNKNRLHSENSNPVETMAPVVIGGEEQYSPSDEPSDDSNQDVSHQDHIPQLEITTSVPTTSTSAAEEPSTWKTSSSSGLESSVTTTTWSSSTSAIEWDISVRDAVPFYLKINIDTTWEDFCQNIEEFRTNISEFMTDNNSRMQKEQVILLYDDRQCGNERTQRYIRSSSIEIEMYFVDADMNYDMATTTAFLTLWEIGMLSDNKFGIRDVHPVESSTPDESSGGGAGVIAAITISCIGAVCLLLLAILWILMRKRQKKFNYGQQCTPVSLDAYSLDSVSVCGSVRRKGVIRSSKRSYGNAGFDDPTTPSHPMGFAGLANFVSNRQAMEEEFANIPHITANVDDLPEGADTKNRYANVIPLPETRVPLTLSDGESLSDYINANFVHGPKNVSKYYIACQAPLPTTVTDFWRMIWEQQSKVILMLTDLMENGVEKSADYLPPSEVLDCHRLFGDFQITLKKREVKEKYIISTLQLKNLETNSWREVTHFWYVSWPALGVPDDVSSVIAFLLESRPYMQGGPCVIHCSPGTGRTGTVIASDLCIRDFETSRIVDIPQCVARIRRERAGAVQTRDQYVFIYSVINLYGTKLTGSALDSM